METWFELSNSRYYEKDGEFFSRPFALSYEKARKSEWATPVKITKQEYYDLYKSFLRCSGGAAGKSSGIEI